jgi:MFS family permease
VLQSISLSAVLINLAAIMERADETLLPAVYREVGQDFGASPSQLGYLTFIRAFVQSISSPIAGVLALRYSRPTVVGFGTLFWAFSTAGVAISGNLTECAIWRAINGMGLAIVIPSLQSFIADSNNEDGRGLAFGWLNLVGCIGGIGGGTLATILAGHTFWGFAGWRVAHMLVALLSTVIGLLVHFYVTDPKERMAGSRKHHHQDG